MKNYYFTNSVDEKGLNEVHTEDCIFVPSVMNRTWIGVFDSCKAAIDSAKIQYPQKKFDGCFYCCNSCHKG